MADNKRRARSYEPNSQFLYLANKNDALSIDANYLDEHLRTGESSTTSVKKKSSSDIFETKSHQSEIFS